METLMENVSGVNAKTVSDFVEGSSFDGVWFPKYDNQPNGPKMQSMVKCKCGAYWKHHRMRDGACPIKEQSCTTAPL